MRRSTSITAADSSGLPDTMLARVLAVPLRRRILELLVAADHALTIAELTDELGCNHNAVRQHLARLREVGLVAEALEERSTPGRPRLLYTATARPNPYARLARLLLAARRAGLSPRAAGRRQGLATATSQALDDRDAVDVLEADAALHGFAPRRVGRGRRTDLVLDVCPFADIAVDDPPTVCALHRGLAEGLVEAVGGARVEAFVARDPYQAGCRIGVRRTT
jgi:predicted ArsR family transcriptional regulator